jgi:hypothetical protein
VFGLTKGQSMRTATAHLKSASPYSQSKFIREKKSRDITHAEFEEQNWRQRLHVNEDGFVFIPPMSFKNCLSEAAKYKSIQIPGKGKSTYTKHFEAGILCYTPVVLPIKADDVAGEWLHVPSDGKRGGTTRVEKCFPVIQNWAAAVQFTVFDEIIDDEVFQTHLEDAGQFIGVGRFRPRNNGFYGRFKVVKIEWN